MPTGLEFGWIKTQAGCRPMFNTSSIQSAFCNDKYPPTFLWTSSSGFVGEVTFHLLPQWVLCTTIILRLWGVGGVYSFHYLFIFWFKNPKGWGNPTVNSSCTNITWILRGDAIERIINWGNNHFSVQFLGKWFRGERRYKEGENPNSCWKDTKGIDVKAQKSRPTALRIVLTGNYLPQEMVIVSCATSTINIVIHVQHLKCLCPVWLRALEVA